MNSPVKKACSLVVVFSMLFTGSARADLSAAAFASSPSEKNFPFSIELPFDLGSVEEIRTPDSGAKAPYVVLIQTMHGHYETAVKIKGLVEHLHSDHAVNLLFAEGASGPLHPEYLRFTENPEKNDALLDELVRKGEMTGADLALSQGQVEGIGIESAPNYRNSYEAFKYVLGRHERNEKTLEAARMDLDRRASRVMTPELRAILSRWLKFGSGKLELLATVDFLRAQAPSVLGIDFETAFAQFDWPQVTRLVLLAELAKRQKQELWKAEKTALVEKIEMLGLDKSFPDFLETRETAGLPRRRVEQFIALAAPAGLRLTDYPQAVYKAASKVLESEIDSRQLYEEIGRLFEKILSSSVRGPEEQALIEEYKRLRLADKLLRLELSPEEWRAWQEMNAHFPAPYAEALAGTLKQAEGFYLSMEEREQSFLEAVDQTFRSTKSKTAVLVAGGFHGRQMMDKLENLGIGSVLVTPHISGGLEHSLYQKIMLRGATLEQTLLSNGAQASISQGWDVKVQADAVRQVLKDQGVDLSAQAPYFSAVSDALSLRSELRSMKGSLEDAVWDGLIGKYKVDGKIADTRDREGNLIGKFASTPSPYVDSAFAAMELPREGPALVVDAGHGTGNLLFRFASRAGKLNPDIRFIGIEGSEVHYKASADLLKTGLKRKLLIPGQVELLQGNFNGQKDLFRKADVVYYAEAGTRDLSAFAETLHELQPGARVVALGEDQSQPGKLRELLTEEGAFDAETKEGFPQITVYTRRSELRTSGDAAGYQLVEKEFDVKALFPADQQDKALKQIVFVSDNTGTMVKNYGDPLSDPILKDSLHLLGQAGFFLLINSGDPLKDLAEKTYTPLLTGLSGEGREHFHIVADGGASRIGFSGDGAVRYRAELDAWPKARRFEYAKALADAFYKEIKKRKGALAEALKDISDEAIDLIREERLSALEAIGPEAWGEKKPSEAKYIFDLLPQDFQKGWGRVFVYDVGPKVTFDAPSMRDFLPADFTPGIMAEVQKKYPAGTEDLYVVSVPGAVDMARVSKVEGVEKTLAEQIYPQLDPEQPLLMVVIGDGDNDIPTFSLKGPEGFSHAVVPVFLRDLPGYSSRLPEGTFVADEKMAGTAQVLDHLARHAGKKISDIPPLKLRQWQRSELRAAGTETIGLDGRLKGLDLYEKVFSQARDTTLHVGRDIAHTGALQAAAVIRGIQSKVKAYEEAGQKDRDIFIIFATGNTQWLGLTTLASFLEDWGSWDAETRQLLTANGVDLSDKPDMGRVFATHLDTIFPQSRDDYYSYANELHSMFDKLGISREKRRMFYGDVKNDQIEPGADNQMDGDAFEKVQASIDKEGLKLDEFLSGQLVSDHPQYAYLDAVNRYTKKMSEFVSAKGPDIALFSAGPSYEGKGHFAFNEAGTPFDQGLVMSLLSYHAAAGNIKDRGGMQHFRTPEGAVKIGGATLGPKEIRSSSPIFITIINGKEKRESVRSLVERTPDVQYPMTALQTGAPGSVLIMESASGSTLRFFTNPWDFSEISAREWTADFQARLFIRLSKETGKPVSAVTVDDWLQSPGKDQAEIEAIRARNLIALTTLQPWEVLRDEVVKTLTKEPLKSEQVPSRLGLRAGDEIVHIGPHLDDLSLAAQFLVSEFSKQGHRLYSYYTAPGYTAVSDEYVLSALGTLKNFTTDELTALEKETQSTFAFKQNEEKYLRQLIKVLAERDLAYDPMNYDTWSLMPPQERKLRAKLLFLRLNFESSLKGQLSTPERVTALRDALEIYIKAKPHWGSSEIAVMQKLKVALRFVEEQTELMSRGVGYEDIFFPFQSSWYALERKGTARQSDIDVIKDVIRSRKPRMVIVNGEGFMDHGAHSITEMTVKVAVKELYEENALPEGFRMFFYRGVWDRAEITGRPDQILVALGEEELNENKSSFVRNYPSQAPALVPDASVKEPMFFSDQVVTNARETLAEWAALNGRATDDPALQGILAFDMMDFNSVTAVQKFLAEVVAKKTELDRVQVPINRASLSKIIGSAPPYADLSAQPGEKFLSVLAAAGFPFETVLTKEEIEKTKVEIRSELRAEEPSEALKSFQLSGSVQDFDKNPFPVIEKLSSWFAQHRWFMEKGNTVNSIEYVDAFILGEENGRFVHGMIVRLRLANAEGQEFTKQYFIPVIVSQSQPEGLDSKEAVVVRLDDGERYLSLAEHQGLYQKMLLEHFQNQKEIFTWNQGRIVFSPSDFTLQGIKASETTAGPLGVSTSNVLTKVTSEGASVVSKTYKDMRGASGQGDKVWPSNTEVPKYEALARGNYPYMPPLYGTMEYVTSSGQRTALGLMMKAVKAETEAGGVFWEGLTRFMKTLKAADPSQAEKVTRNSLEGASIFARELAGTVAEMHTAFLKSGSDGFTAAPASQDEIQGWEQSGQHHLAEALSSLDQRIAANPGDVNLKRIRAEFVKRREAVQAAKNALEGFQGVLMKAPVHGDLSTAQGLIEALGDTKLNQQYWDTAENGDPVQSAEKARTLISQVRWLDFEGPPAKESVASDFDQRENWIKDVAGVLEGFWYIANIQLFSFLELNPQERPEDREEARKASLVLSGYADVSDLSRKISPEVIRLINQWVTETTNAFLDGYFDTLEKEGYGNAVLSRWDRETARSLVDYYLMERATHEFHYEFYAREWGWEGIPGTRILQLTDSGRLTKPAAEARTYTASDHTVFGGALTEVTELPKKEFFSPIDAAIPVDGAFFPFHHMRHADDWGIGNFHTAKIAGDFAHALGYHVMQDLPATYSSAGNSPYSVLSALLLDPVYLSAPEAARMMERSGIPVAAWQGFLEENSDRIEALKNNPQIQHQEIINLNLAALRLVWAVFQEHQESPLWMDFELFRKKHQEMVEDDLLYLQLKIEQGGDWRNWEAGLRDRDPAALQAARERLRSELDFQAFVQYVLDVQRQERDAHYQELGVSTMVDMAFAPPDAEIWKNPAAVGMSRANGYRRDAVQGVPGKKEAPVGQLWNFSVYDWSNPAALALFIKVFKINLERADYLRVDHTLGLYRIFVFLQKGLSLGQLGIEGKIAEIRRRALQENTDDAKNRAVSQTWELIRSALLEKGRELGLPPEVFTLFFDETGQLRKGGNMVMAARKVPKALHEEKLPPESRWQRLHWEEDDLFEGEPKWDTIRLTPNERAQDNGDIRTWLFPEDGREPAKADDQIRLGYFRLSPGETAMAELARIAQESGKKLIFETLGTVPEPIQKSSSRFGNNYYPLVYGLEPSSWYNPLKIKSRSGMMTFNVADTGSPDAAWSALKDWSGVKGPLVRAFFPDLPGEQFDPHMRAVTPAVHEKLLQLVYDPQGVYPQISEEHLPLIALLGLIDIANLPENYRLNIPGQGGQWINKLPPDLSLENLTAAARGLPATDAAKNAVRVIRSLQEKRARHTPLTTPEDVRILRTSPDVKEDGLQIRIISQKNPASTAPFFVETYVQGNPQRVELVVRSKDGREARFDVQKIRSERGENAAVSNFGALLRPAKPGIYEFRFEIEKPDLTRDVTGTGRLIAVSEGADLNPMSPNYVLTPDARGFRSELRTAEQPEPFEEAAKRLLKHLAVQSLDIPADHALVVLGNPYEGYAQAVVKKAHELNSPEIVIIGKGGAAEPERVRLRREILAIDPELAPKIKGFDSIDESMHTGMNVTSLAQAVKDGAVQSQNFVLTQIPTGGLLSLRIFEHQWKQNAEALGLSLRAPGFYFAPVSYPFNIEVPLAFSSKEERFYLEHAVGQIDRLKTWPLNPNPPLVLKEGDLTPEILEASEMIRDFLSRSELRDTPQDVSRQLKRLEVPAVRLPFIVKPTGRDVYDAALILGGMADPSWKGAELTNYRLALRAAVESYYQREGGEGFEGQVSRAQSVLRENKQVIALFAHIEDVSADSALRQIFETAAFLAGENQAKAHYVVLTVDRAEDTELLRDKLLDFLNEKYPEDAGLRNQLYARLPVIFSGDPGIASLLPRGAVSAWVDWNSPAQDSAVIPEPAREKQVRADQLPSGEVLQFDETNRGYGVSLLQAALLLLQGEEDSRLQQIRKGIYAQSSRSALAGIGQVLKALQLISKSA